MKSSDLVAGNRGFRLVFCNAHRTLEAAGFCPGHITGHAVDFRIVMRINHDLVIRAYEFENRVHLADLLGTGTRQQKQQRHHHGDGQHRHAKDFFHGFLSLNVIKRHSPAT